MLRLKYFRKNTNIFLIILILSFNLFSIIQFPHTFIKINDNNVNENGLSFVHSSSSGPPNGNYFKYYKDIIINHSKVSGSSDLINFPVLISLVDSDLHDKVQGDGDDIAFSNGTIWLDHEIEKFNQTYNSTHAQLIAWVRVPVLYHNEDTKIYMYYGNATMGSQENSSGLWNSNYAGVWHLNETTGNVLDSTSHGLSGTPTGGIIQGVDGQIDGSYDFVVNGSVSFGDSNYVDFGTNSFTVSFWININGSTGSGRYQLPLWKGAQSGWNPGYDFESNSEGADLRFGICDGGNDGNESDPVVRTKGFVCNLDHDTWVYIVGVVDRDDQQIRLYKNDQEVDSGTDISSVASIDNFNPLMLSPQDYWYLNGSLDEIRISNIARSADWIATEYNNQKDPNSFYSIGSAYTTLKPEYFNYYKRITIDHTKVSATSDLINFPFLLSIYDTDLRTKVQADGDDIAFYYGTEWLDHEIEFFNQTYNSTHAQLVAWIRIPSLSPITNTTIKMYYGNSTMNSRQNSFGVWDSGYRGVWHLSESSGNATDSTSYNTDGILSGGVVQGFQGKISTSYKFDGNDDFVSMTQGTDNCLNITTDEITLEAWVSYDINSEHMGIMAKGGYNAGYRLLVRTAETDENIQFQLNASATYHVISNTKVDALTWHHVVGVYNGSKMLIYINGVQDPNTKDRTGDIDPADNPLVIGHGNLGTNPYPFNGSIDEVRISSIARSASWIATEYNNQYNPSTFYTISSQKVPDNTPPTYSNLTESSDPLELGDIESISINVSDSSGINEVKIEFGGSNHSMVNVDGETWQYAYWTPTSVNNYTYTIWMEDNYGNWNFTSGSIEVIDTRAPTYLDLIESADPLQLGQNETITIKVYDSPGSGVNQVLLEYDSLNHSMNFVAGNTWRWTNWKPSSSGMYDYKIYMQDNEDNWNMTSGTITVVSTTAPVIENLKESETPLELGHDITITVDVSDNETNVSTVLIELGAFNYTMKNSTTTSYYITFIYNFNWSNPSVGTTFYKVYANDTDNNWNYLSSSFEIVDTTSPNFLALIENEDPLELGNTEIISINCTDLSDIVQVLIEFENSNHSMVNSGGDLWQYNSWMPDSVGNYSYTIYMRDNYNNWNYTIDSILVQDTTAPRFSNLIESADPVELGSSLTITIIITDLSDIVQALIEFENSNHSMVNPGGDLWQYNSWMPNSVGNYSYTIYMRDNYNNWNCTSSSVVFKDTISPTYSNLIESADPLELGSSITIRINVNDFAGINQTLIEFEGSNHSMLYIGGSLWEYNSWKPSDRIIYQYRIFMEDNSGNWNNVTGDITTQDTTAPLAPFMTNAPSGNVNGILTFDWLDGSDPSGISFYILIIDNESNPDTTPGYVYFINITNLGIQSSYLEVSEMLPPGKYYYFLSQIDGVGHKSISTKGTFTIISNPPPNNDSLLFIIIGIILASLIGSTVAVILVKKRVQKNVVPKRKKISYKSIVQHINKISNLQIITEKDEIVYEKSKTAEKEGLADEFDIEVHLMEIKAFAEELFNEGAYLEAIKQFEIAKNRLMEVGRKEEAKLFSELIEGITGLIEKRELLLQVLEQSKYGDNMGTIFDIYYDVIHISNKLRDFDAVNLYHSELLQILKSDIEKLKDLRDYRAILEGQINPLLLVNDFEKTAELYEKCELISQLLVKIGRQEEQINAEKYRIKKNEYLDKSKQYSS